MGHITNVVTHWRKMLWSFEYKTKRQQRIWQHKSLKSVSLETGSQGKDTLFLYNQLVCNIWDWGLSQVASDCVQLWKIDWLTRVHGRHKLCVQMPTVRNIFTREKPYPIWEKKNKQRLTPSPKALEIIPTNMMMNIDVTFLSILPDNQIILFNIFKPFCIMVLSSSLHLYFGMFIFWVCSFW